MSLFNELKQRNVFKVAIAYTVVGWLLIQVAEVVAPQMNLPEWTPRMITFVVMLGFPVSLVMAWALELTPEGIRKSSGSNTSVYVIAAVLLALSFYWFLNKAEQAPPATMVQAPAESIVTAPETQDTPSVAVLPFVNMSADADNEYFSDGITEELLNLLVRIDGLRVPSRTSSFAFKGRNTDIKEIASQLEVEHVLEGSVRKSGNRLRITAQLIDVATDTHLWSETYDRELVDIFAIQEDIAARIVEALKLTLAPQLVRIKRTENLEAYNLYLQGLFLFQKRGNSLLEAEKLLLQAIDLDPNFAEAHATLAMTYVQMPNYLSTPRQDVHQKTIDAAQRALELKPDLVEASMAIAQIFAVEQRWAESISLFERIVADHPQHAIARLWYAIVLLKVGYMHQALESAGQSLRLDPASGLVLDWNARLLIMNGRGEEAASLAERAIQLGRRGGRIPLAHHFLATRDASRLYATLDRGDPYYNEMFVQFIQVAEDAARLPLAMEFANRIPGDARQGGLAKMLFATATGNVEDIYTQFTFVVAFADGVIAHSWWPAMKGFRQSAYFKQWVQDLNLLTFWQQNGWPDLCRPLEGDDFECD